MAIQGFFTGDVKIRDLNGVLKAVDGIVEVATDAGTVTSVGLTVGSTGTDVNVANSPVTTSGNITLNLPTASATNRGLLSSADWAIFDAKQGSITLTTTGNNGSATLTSGTLNIPTYTLAGLGGISLTSLSASIPLAYNNTTGAFSIQVANGSQGGYLSSSDWTTFNNKQAAGNYVTLDTYQTITASKTFSVGFNLASVGGTNQPTFFENTNNLHNGSVGSNIFGFNTANNIYFGKGSDNGGVLQWNNSEVRYYTLPNANGTIALVGGAGVGTVTSVGLTMPSAFAVSSSPVTGSGTIAVTGAGIASQYIRGDGTLANFPTSGGGGGASVSYYLNGSVNQGTFGGVTYYEMNKTPIIGAGTDFTINANGYIASFLTDAGDPALLNIPAGNWNFEMFFSASSGGGTPSFYVELYKYDGTTFTLISSGSATPESITNGTAIDLYTTALTVPSTTLTLTDRLAIRIYVTHSGRTITLHTEDNHLCQVITTFTTGLTALNGLTAQVQYLATGTSGTDFNIASATATHTFNLPTASATNRGALSSADWTTFNNKQNALTNPITGTGTSGQVAFFNGTNSITSNAAFAFTPTSQLLVNNSVTAASAIARGTNLTPTLVAAANNDVLVGLDINPTFTNGAFTGTQNIPIRVLTNVNKGTSYYIKNSSSGNAAVAGIDFLSDVAQGSFFATSSTYTSYGVLQSSSVGFYTTKRFAIAIDSATDPFVIGLGISPTEKFRINNNGNVGINQSTDAGFRLDVNGTARVIGNARVDGNLELFYTGLGTRNINFYQSFGSSNINAQISVDTGANRISILGVTNELDFVAITASKVASGSTTDYALSVNSTTKGFLLPRLSTTQRDAIRQFNTTSLNAGLTIYNSTTNTIEFYNGTSWVSSDSGTGAAGQIAYWTGANTQAGSATLTYTPTSALLVNNSVTAASAIARGTNLTPTLTAAANNDVLVGLDINPTFTNGAFTGVTNYSIRANGLAYFTGPNYGSFTINAATYSTLSLASNGTSYGFIGSGQITGGGLTDLGLRSTGIIQFAAGSTTAALTITSASAISSPAIVTLSRSGGALTLDNASGNAVIYNISGTYYGGVGSANTLLTGGTANVMALQGTNGIQFITGGVAATNLSAQIFASTGNVLIQRGGTFTDAGFRLDVNGTARVTGNIQADSLMYFSSTSAASIHLGGVGAGSTYFIIRNFSGITNSGIQRINGTNQPVEFYQRGSTTNEYVFRFSSTDGRTMGNGVNGINDYIRIGDFTYNNPSTNNYSGSILNINPTYNITAFTGTILRGIYYNPALTSLTGTTHIAFQNTTGDVLLGTTSGNVAIGTSTLATATELTLGGSQTASSAIARGQLLNTTLVAAANNDVLVGLDINPTFTNGAFTGVTNYAARFANNVLINGVGSNIPLLILNSNGTANNQVGIDFYVANSSVFSIGYYTTPSANFYIFNPTGSVFPFRIWRSSNNVGLSTTTDAGFKLDVNGTARVQGQATIQTLTVGLGGGSVATNTAVGYLVGAVNTTGSANTSFGYLANAYNTTGSNNSAFGREALGSNITQNNNSAFGTYTLAFLDNGSNNAVFGAFGLVNLRTGSNNTALGASAGRYISGGVTSAVNIDNSIFIGQNTKALADAQTNQIVIGYNVTGLGSNTTVLGNSSTTLTALYGSVITGGTSINASAQLQVDSTSKGFLPPRMTTTQKNAIATPATGLAVYDTTLSGIAVYNGTNWQNVLVPNSNNNVLIGTTTDNGQGTLQNTGSAFLGGLQVGGLTFSTSTTATTSTIFYYFNGGSGQTLTLPSTVGISSYFLIKNAGTAALTISRSGSTDTIMAPNGTSTTTTISLAVGSQAILVSNGAFVWIQIV